MIYPLILSGILLYFSGGAGVNTLELNITVKSGSSGIMPCVYDKKYKENRKYLCLGTYWNYCRILAYTNKTGKYSITDYPNQSIFTVGWDNLQTSDSGYYWCAVEIRGIDDGYYLYLTVQSAPDVSVVSSSVSGHEGGNVSVQCFYSSGYKNKLKQWCRYKDQSCYTVGRTDTSQNPSVQISDDGRSSFTVLMTGLRLSDSGWYWCSAGEALNPVHLTVTEAEPVNEATDRSRDSSETEKDNNSNAEGKEQETRDPLSVWLAVSAALLLLLILAAVFTWRWKWGTNKQENGERNNSRTIDAIYCEPEEPALYLHYYSTINYKCSNDPNKDITYSTISDAPGSEAKPPTGGAIYSTVAPH